MFIALAVLIMLSAVGTLVAGSLALLRSPSLRLNQTFFALSVVLGFWITFNYFGSSVAKQGLTQILVKLDFSFAIFIVWFLLYFATFLMTKNTHSRIKKSKKFFVASLTVNLLLVSAILAGLVVHIQIHDKELSLTNTNLYFVYVGVICFYILFAFKNFLMPFLRLKPVDKKKFNLILIGVFLAATTNVLSNIVFPAIFSSRQTVQSLNLVGYLGILVFVFSLYVSITTRRLFDIRLIIARSLGYLLSLAVLVVAYGFVTNAISNLLSSEAAGVVFAKNAFSTLVIIATALSYVPLRRVFDRATNRFFYRDAYDTQFFLDEFNKVLVSTIELNKLLTDGTRIIETNLKSEFCFVGIKEIGAIEQRIIGSMADKKISKQDIDEVRSITPFMNRKVIITDELTGRYDPLKLVLSRHNIAMLVRLVDKVDEGTEGLGYLVLGAKKSGSPYNKQDIKVVDIITNELVIAIQNALRFEEIENFNATLQEQIEAATHRLQRTNDKLQQMDETKDEFISMASHQLRTPLTSVKGYLSMVLEGDAGKLNDMQRKLLDQAFVSSQRMVYLIADLLNVSRLRTGKFLVEPVEVNLSDIVEGEVSQLFETAKGRGLTLVYKKPDKFPKLMLDETKIRQVVMNFTDNAIYYTPAGGHITIHLVDKKDTVEFAVVDDGIGVPKHEQHHLFTKFYRAPNAKKARPDGTGLGLFMAQKVIIAQGGSIIFHSHEGKGSTFGFSFAKARLRPPEIAPAAEMAKALAS